MNDSVTGLISLWMLLQLAVLLMILLGGLYVLYCLNRAASGMERMASALEFWVQQNAQREAERAQREAERAPIAPPAPPAGGTPSWMQPIEIVPPAPPTEEKREQL